ncbi:MAG: hypothetical protein JWL62_2552 [Hyphomicrobiales bacterium]|nr:hypothetical protein [Hyphomicrobiales bacterium]
MWSAGRLVIFALLLSGPSLAQESHVISEKNISFGMAKEIGDAALEACRKDGSHVTVTVLDRNGTVRVTYRDDGAAPHTSENSMRKAYSALTFEAPSATFARRLDEAPGKIAQVHLTGVIALAGGVPVLAGKEVIGAVGISGSKPGPDKRPGGTRDEACAKVGIDKVSNRLN